MQKWKRIGCVIDGNDLVVVQVQRALFGLSDGSALRIEGFLDLSAQQQRSALSSLPSGAELVVVIPSAWCGLRPIALSSSAWRSARSEIVDSIEGFFPLSSEDACVGYVQSSSGGSDTEEGTDKGGYIIGCSMSRVRQWVQPMQEALAARSVRVVSPHMALAGLGLQSIEHALITERSVTGEPIAHSLRFGEIDALDEPLDEAAEAHPRGASFALGQPVDTEAHRVSGDDLAIAACIAGEVAGRLQEPLMGPAWPRSRQWVVPVATVAAAACLVLTAGWLWDTRLERATESATAQIGALDEQMSQAESIRADAERLAELVAMAGEMTGDWSALAPDLASAMTTLPPDAHLYEVQIDQSSIRLIGEASSAADVIRALQSNDRFSNVERESPPRPVHDRFTFDVDAQRSLAAEGGA